MVMVRGTLSGKVAIVTGGGGGIGRATACMLAEDGADVAVVDLKAQGAQDTAQQVRALGRRALALTVDVTDYDAVKRAVAAINAKLGTPLVTVSNAGTAGETNPFHDENKANLLDQLRVHVEGAYHWLRETIGPMRQAGWGRLVVTSSIAATIGLRNGSSYAAAKGALIGLVRTVALENTSRGVTANCVLPGVIETDILKSLPPEQLEKMRRGNPAKRFGKPEDIAAAIAYLCSEQAGYVTGQCISPNGGLWFS